MDLVFFIPLLLALLPGCYRRSGRLRLSFVAVRLLSPSSAQLSSRSRQIIFLPLTLALAVVAVPSCGEVFLLHVT